MVFPNQTNQMQGNTGKKKKNRKRNRNKPWTSAPYLVGSNQFNNVPDSNFQAPYQDELIDLTDDLAPKIAESRAPEPSGLPIDNKLSFKLQNNEKQQGWMQYQNKFKSIEGDTNVDALKLTQNITDQKQKQLNQEMDSETKQPGLLETDVDMKSEMNDEVTLSSLRIAVVTDPYHYMTQEQAKYIDDALVIKIQDAVISKNEESPYYIPTFKVKPSHHNGHVPLWCEGPKDLRWVHKAVLSIPSPIPDTKLTIIPQSDVPHFVKMSIFVPNYSRDLGDLKMLLQKQNHWCDIASWTLFNTQKYGDEPASYCLRFCVPNKQASIIETRGRRLAYSLGSISVRFYDARYDNQNERKTENFTSNHLRVSVITEPFHYLTMLQTELIKLALTYKLETAIFESKSEDYVPTFRGNPCHMKGGLKLWCESDRDLRWRKEAVSQLASPIFGSKLVVKLQSEIPERARVKVFLPDCTEDINTVVKVLKSQNKWCDMESWAMFTAETHESNPNGVIIVFYIPVEHVPLLQKRGCRLSYLLGYVNIRFFGPNNED